MDASSPVVQLKDLLLPKEVICELWHVNIHSAIDIDGVFEPIGQFGPVRSVNFNTSSPPYISVSEIKQVHPSPCLLPAQGPLFSSHPRQNAD